MIYDSYYTESYLLLLRNGEYQQSGSSRQNFQNLSHLIIAERMADFAITLGNHTGPSGNPFVHTHGSTPVLASSNHTVSLEPPQYGSVVGVHRLQGSYDSFTMNLCEVVVIGRRAIGGFKTIYTNSPLLRTIIIIILIIIIIVFPVFHFELFRLWFVPGGRRL